MEDREFEWRDEDESEWTSVYDEGYRPLGAVFKTHREAAQYIADKWYMLEGEHEHRYKIFVRDISTKPRNLSSSRLVSLLNFGESV